MNIEEFREYCISKKGVEETFPFDNNTLVMKVLDKMFALGNLDGPLSINLKCDPEKAVELREQYAAVKPGYHMSKMHWNTVEIDGSIDIKTIQSWIDDSYNLVVSKMSKSKQELLKQERSPNIF
ncbi:MAG: MmcQ/YjbR family DNA-binding protein [Bacteroidales bacterium]|nr:MmcQ/YjbR family DNA-binding protein [Bacteroidales bacterium]